MAGEGANSVGQAASAAPLPDTQTVQGWIQDLLPWAKPVFYFAPFWWGLGCWR